MDRSSFFIIPIITTLQRNILFSQWFSPRRYDRSFDLFTASSLRPRLRRDFITLLTLRTHRGKSVEGTWGAFAQSPQTKQNVPLFVLFLPRERADDEGRGRRRGFARAKGETRVGEREREPDVLIKRLIFIARQKREFNAHLGLMRRPTADSPVYSLELLPRPGHGIKRVAASRPIRLRRGLGVHHTAASNAPRSWSIHSGRRNLSVERLVGCRPLSIARRRSSRTTPTTGNPRRERLV